MKAGWPRVGGRKVRWFLAIWLVAGLGLSVLTFVLLWSKRVGSQNEDLDGRCLNAAVVLQGNLMSSVFSAGMYNGLIHAFPEISRDDFETYADFTNFILPYCNGISYMRYVPGPQRPAFEALLGSNFTQYGPRETGSSVPAFLLRGNASEYLISWRMSNRAYQAFFSGYDLLSDPEARALAIVARDSGMPQVSGPFKAPLDGSTALSVLWPFYTQNPFVYRSVAARRANFKGVVMALFDVQNLFNDVASRFKTTVEELDIFDITNVTDSIHGGVLVYNKTKSGARHGKRISSVKSQQRLSGRSYRVECRQYVSVGQLLAMSLPWSCLVLLVFLLVAFVVWYVTRRFKRDKEAVHRVEKLNTELELARQTAESADKAKSSFLAMMSHELRTPMTGTLGMLDLLRLTAMTDEQCLYVTTMQSSAESLLACLNDILDFSKIEAGQLRLEEIDFDIGDVVQQVTTLFSGKLQEKGLQIRTNLPPHEDCKARGDPLRLQQILTNLISNAIKFTDRGSISIHWRRLNGAHLSYRGQGGASFSSFRDDVAVGIDPTPDASDHGDRSLGCLESLLRKRRLRTVQRGDLNSSNEVKSTSSRFQGSSPSSQGTSDSDGLWYEFGVSDTGLGITAEVQQRLFRSFVQADDSTTRMFGGTGLGLVICKKLVTAMGGSISVQSQVNEGSTFTCVVCLRPQRLDSPSTAKLQPSERQHTDRLVQLSDERLAASEMLGASDILAASQSSAASEILAASKILAASATSSQHSPRSSGDPLPEIQPSQNAGSTEPTTEPADGTRLSLEMVEEARSGEPDRDTVSTTEPSREMSMSEGEPLALGRRFESVERIKGDTGDRNEHHTGNRNGETLAGSNEQTDRNEPHMTVMGRTGGNARAQKAENVTEGASAESSRNHDASSTDQQTESVETERQRSSGNGHVAMGDSPPSTAGVSAPSISPAAGGGSTGHVRQRDTLCAAHILVAEDNLVNQMLIKRMLGQFGHKVDIVANGALAVAAVKAHDYALCLMDLQMPVLDGIGATEQIRQLDSPKCDLPIYVLSADVLAQNKLSSKDLRFDGYLTKPIKWDVLLGTVEEKLKAKGLMRRKS